MKPRTSGVTRDHKSKESQSVGPNWVLVAGGALLSTLSVRLGYKLKQVLDRKQPENTANISKGTAKSTQRNRSANCTINSDSYSFAQEDSRCCNCQTGSRGRGESKHQWNGQELAEPEIVLPLVTVPAPEFGKENGVIWASSPDRLELPQKPFHHSNSSDSPCVSESGSEVFSKREVIHKLRQQLKRRDDMILEMQEQIVELQNTLNAQLSHSSHLQSLLDAANRDLFDSEREIQRLRKAIADHCVGQVGPCEKPPTVPTWLSGGIIGNGNGHIESNGNLDFSERGKGDAERIELLRREVSELKEVIEGKEYLLQTYKEQKTELSMKIKELQRRLDSEIPNIL